MVDVFAARVAGMNADAQSAKIDRALLEEAIRAQGVAFQEAISAGHDHLFADTALFVTAAQVGQMRAVIEAVERAVNLPGWMNGAPAQHDCLGVFYGYDFHINEQGAHLIEINTNAGGGFLNALLIDSQREQGLPGAAAAVEDLGHTFFTMFQNEWRLARGDAPLNTVAIVDDQPEAQYLYPEFLLAKKLFESEGVAVHIADPTALAVRDQGLYLADAKIDLVYNRLTDFSLQQYPALRQAYLDERIVLTPNPAHHARYADKRNLARLSDADGLRLLGANEADIAVLQSGVPHAIIVKADMKNVLWAERRQLFFKPNSGYGSKGAYRGGKMTKRVFAGILQSDYVAQQIAPPGERSVCLDDGEPASLKFDLRCYVHDGQIQLVAARLYQGQTTNFRTPGGGFALVRVVG